MTSLSVIGRLGSVDANTVEESGPLPLAEPALGLHPSSSTTSTLPTDVLQPAGARSALRKQNVACDACRTKKVRCQRLTITEKCAQCVAKDSECTSLYLEQLQSKAKKTRGDPARKRRRKSESCDEEDDQPGPSRRGSNGEQEGQRQSFPTVVSGRPNGEAAYGAKMADAFDVGRDNFDRSLHLVDPFRQSLALQPSVTPQAQLPSMLQNNLLRYLFDPYPVLHHGWGYSDTQSLETSRLGQSDMWEEENGRVWSAQPTKTHIQLTDEDITTLASDLIETFFSIAHPRFPLFDPMNVRDRIASPDLHPDGPLEHNLIAVAIAFGARFSDHVSINSDRDEYTSREDRRHRRRKSRLVQLLVIRAREVAETCKTHRIRTMNNVRVLILLETLSAQIPYLKDRYQPYHFNAAVKHMCALGFNKPSHLLSIVEEREKMEAVYTWGVLTISDAFRAVFHRLSPCLSDVDAPPVPASKNGSNELPALSGVQMPTAGPSPDPTDQAVVWHNAANAGSLLCRQMCAVLWNHRAEEYGISFAGLRDFVHANLLWRDNYLSRLGVPSKFPDTWDFLAAITAASSDAYYYALWLVVNRAIKDFGVAELRNPEDCTKSFAKTEIESTRNRIKEESEHAALRIAALTAVLYENAYLRLDPLIMHHPIYEAGLFLADEGRDECLACVAGLRQYSISFPQFWDCAGEIEKLYWSRVARPVVEEAAVPGPGSTVVVATNWGGIFHNEGWLAKGWENRGSTLAENGYTAFPDVRRGAAGGELEDLSFAIFEWLKQA